MRGSSSKTEGNSHDLPSFVKFPVESELQLAVTGSGAGVGGGNGNGSSKTRSSSRNNGERSGSGTDDGYDDYANISRFGSRRGEV